jgi:hypothetical protein
MDVSEAEPLPLDIKRCTLLQQVQLPRALPLGISVHKPLPRVKIV